MVTTPKPVAHQTALSSQRKTIAASAERNVIYSGAARTEKVRQYHVPSEDVASDFGFQREELRAHSQHVNDIKRSCFKRQPDAASVELSMEHSMTLSTPARRPMNCLQQATTECVDVYPSPQSDDVLVEQRVQKREGQGSRSARSHEKVSSSSAQKGSAAGSKQRSKPDSNTRKTQREKLPARRVQNERVRPDATYLLRPGRFCR